RLRDLAAIGEIAFDPNAYIVQGLRELGRRISRVAPIGGERVDLDALEAVFSELPRARFRTGRRYWWEYAGAPRDVAPDLPIAEFRERRARVVEDLKTLNRLLDADLAARLQQDLRPVVDAYVQRLNSAGVLDFLDLLRSVRDLLVRDEAVRRELGARFTHLFVDEFQDTDPLQAEILLLLASSDAAEVRPTRIRPKPGKLFVVGDPKQAIYRFRRADILLYERVKEQLLGAGAELLNLSTSFRSRPAIQSLVNHCFAARMTGGSSQANYVALHNFRKESNEQPSVVVLPVPHPYPNWTNTPRVTLAQLELSLPDAVGAYVDWLVKHSDWQVEEAGQRRRIAARDVCCLFRRFVNFGEDVTRPYVRALEARRLPHVLVGGRSFHGREEVMALRTALQAIEWPDDELMVYATLRGAFFALSDSELLEFKAFVGALDSETPRLGRLHPLRRVPRERMPEGVHAVADALDILGALHVGRNRRPIAETIGRLLAATRAHAGVAIWPTGEQALANVLSLIDKARRYEARGALSFRGFVEWLELSAERGQGSEAPVIEEGTDGVRLMTVHGAKGLEFPVVILCEPGAPLETNRPSRFIDPETNLWAQGLCGLMPYELLSNEAEIKAQDDAEVIRLGYVAATRARDLLVIPGIGDGPFPEERWSSIFHPAIYPEPRLRGNAEPAPGCPSFGPDSVNTRPFSSDLLEQPVVKPGLHRELAAGGGVVWWCPAQLDLDQRERGGVRQQEILMASGEADAAKAAHQAWSDERRARLERGSRSRWPTRSVTQVAHALEVSHAPEESGEMSNARARELAQQIFPKAIIDRADAVSVEAPLSRSSGRPRGARFGTLVHGLLERATLEASSEDTTQLVRLGELLARQLGATERELLAARDACLNALRHPVLLRAREATDLRREHALSYRRPDGELWEGVVDLAFLHSGRWCVVDFKTDVIEDAPFAYRLQVALYCHGLELATGAPCDGVLLGV
ncbi:MAG: UvrD-helicase domain-containing protein, partial [Myxococcales bacterium]|nr:UvrD-helicase domain-containing protein [Myxococcales bacterium]